MSVMIVKYGHFNANAKINKRPEVCIVVKWSPGSLRMADAIATNNFKVLKSNKKKRPLKANSSRKRFFPLVHTLRDEKVLNMKAVEGMKSNTPQWLSTSNRTNFIFSKNSNNRIAN